MPLPEQYLRNRRLETMVENQTSYSLESAEMHIFETHQEAERVFLKFDQPVMASMMQGKKVMHLQEVPSFDFLPGESLILPSGETMCIDFPEAREDQPTQCLAMTMDEEKVNKVVALLNETMPRVEEGEEWQFTDYSFHFTNDIAIHQIIHRLLFLFAEDHPSKDIFAEFMLKELIMRILQTENRSIYTREAMQLSSSHRLAFIVKYIREHLDETLTIEALSRKVYMSESHFYRVFKTELGMSPVDFINNERIKKATALLRNPRKKVKEVYMECGFNSMSYFIRKFKQSKQLTPKAYQQKTQVA